MSIDRDCKCGLEECNEMVSPGSIFAPGHDQKAIHARIKDYGSVEDWLAWEDETLPMLLLAMKTEYERHPTHTAEECNFCQTWEFLNVEWNMPELSLDSEEKDNGSFPSQTSS